MCSHFWRWFYAIDLYKIHSRTCHSLRMHCTLLKGFLHNIQFADCDQPFIANATHTRMFNFQNSHKYRITYCAECLTLAGVLSGNSRGVVRCFKYQWPTLRLVIFNVCCWRLRYFVRQDHSYPDFNSHLLHKWQFQKIEWLWRLKNPI